MFLDKSFLVLFMFWLLKILYSYNLLTVLVLLCLLTSVQALPLKEKIDVFNEQLDTTGIGGFENSHNKTDSLIINAFNSDISAPAQQQKNHSVLSDELLTGDGIESLHYDNYSEPEYTRTRTTASAFFDNKRKVNSNNDEVSNATLISDSLVTQELKEKVKDSIDTIKQVKELFFVDNSISYENSEQESSELIQRNLYLQEQQLQDDRGINKQVSKDKYDTAIFREFISRVLSFILYALIGFIFMKLILMFIAWQRKLNRY